MIWYSKVDFTAGHLLFSLFILKHYELKCKKNCIIVESLKMKTHSDYNFFSSFRSLYNTIFWWSMLNFEREQSIMHYSRSRCLLWTSYFVFRLNETPKFLIFFFKKTSFKEGWAKWLKSVTNPKIYVSQKKLGLTFWSLVPLESKVYQHNTHHLLYSYF